MKIPNDAKSLKHFETVQIDLCSGVSGDSSQASRELLDCVDLLVRFA